LPDRLEETVVGLDTAELRRAARACDELPASYGRRPFAGSCSPAWREAAAATLVAVRTMAVLFAVALLSGGLASAAASPVAVPRDSSPWWAPKATMLAFDRASPGQDDGDALFTPTVRGAEVDILGAGRVRGFRPGSGDVLLETGTDTSVVDGSDREIGRIPGVDASWSPDGTHVAFLQGDALAISEASGAGVRQLATGVVPPQPDATGPVWSPDGTSVAIATTSPAGSSILVVPVDGSAAHAAFDGEGDNVDPSWSRDGSTIAFDRDAGGRWAIWTVAPDGTGAREAVGGAANNRLPQWSPVDDRLAFLSDRGGPFALYVGAVGGAASKLIGDVASDAPARWSPTGAALAVSSAQDCRRFGIYVVTTSAPVRAVRRSNQCRIDGTPRADLIHGTPYYDVVDGHGGNDSIFTLSGDDVAYGGSGNDAIGGGPGNDVIYGGPGNDILSGGPGNDVIYAGPGRDKIGCGPGNDTAYVGPGDTVRDCEHVRRG
jgi:Ca2+-binding RTX toxin-like protein